MTQSDLSQARDTFGHEPSVDIQAGLRRTVQWFRMLDGSDIPGEAQGVPCPTTGPNGMNIAVIGSGRVGLVTGVALASLGHDVMCMDVGRAQGRHAARGPPALLRARLLQRLTRGARGRPAVVHHSVAEAVGGAKAVIICVGRPPVGLDDKSLTAVEEAARAIARAAAHDVVVVVKSTVPPGYERARREGGGLRAARPAYSAVSSPEFLREGHAVQDTLEPDRLVVGASRRRPRRARS